jgi:hypothetical protein
MADSEADLVAGARKLTAYEAAQDLSTNGPSPRNHPDNILPPHEAGGLSTVRRGDGQPWQGAVQEFYGGKGEERRADAGTARDQVSPQSAHAGGYVDPAWAQRATVRKVVGTTPAHWSHDKAQQAQSTERKDFPDQWHEGVADEEMHATKAAIMAAQGRHTEQEALYDISKSVEGDRRNYADQEKQAAQRFSSDMTNARIRMGQARERLASFGKAPSGTVAAAFEKADGPRKVAGLVGMLMGGVGAAGFSAITHQPQKNAFFESFDREASKVVDAWMTDRDTAGKVMSAEQQGMDEIRQAFGDDRAAREYVMASVMKTYASKLDQAAALYGIDKNRADYQAILAKIAGNKADRFAAAATSINESAQQSQKWNAAAPIYQDVPVGESARAAVDPELQRDLKMWQAGEAQLKAEVAKYGHPDRMPAGLQEQIAASNAQRTLLEQRIARAAKVEQGAGAQALMGRQSDEVEESLEGYGKAREDTGVAAAAATMRAVDRIVRRMKGKDQSLRQRVAMFVAGAATERGEALAVRLFADDAEMAQDFATVANALRLEQSGKAVTKTEIGSIVAMMGTGDAESVATVARNLERKVDEGEMNLYARFPEGYELYHARQKFTAGNKVRMPHKDIQAPE